MRKIIALSITIFAVFMFAFFVVEFYILFPIKYQESIKKYSTEYNLNSALVASIICVESRFNKNAKSSKGAVGLMQLMPATYNWVAAELGEQASEQKIFEADTNIRYGCYYLSYLFAKYVNEIYILCCYNAGEGVVATWGEAQDFSLDKIKYLETLKYVKKIENLKRFYCSRIE